MAFLFVFFWVSYDSNVGVFHIVPEVPDIVLISFDSFFFLSASFISTIISSTSLILSEDRISSDILSYSTVGFLQSAFFKSHLLHYSLLIDSSLFLLGPCETFLASSQSLSLVYLSVTPFCFQGLGHLYYDYSEFFFR